MSYNTKQRMLIKEYLKSHSDEHLTADAIENGLKEYNVGKSTVYRFLEKLVAEGEVRRFTMGDGKSACYQYINGEECHSHFHLKCLECGVLMHLECDHLTEISSHINEKHGFSIDNSRTVFYGICNKCKKTEK